MRCIKVLSLSLVLIISNLSKAQNNSERNYITYHNSNSHSDDFYFLPDMKNKTIEYSVEDVKKGKSKKFERSYNSAGRLIAFYAFKDGEKLALELSKYNEQNRLINKKVFKRNTIKHEVKVILEDETNLKSMIELKKGNEIARKNWQYNEDGCTLASTWHKRGKLKRQWTYEYYYKCDRKKSTLMNGKGKIINEWTYDCNSEGEILEKKKDITQVCKWEEVDETLIKHVRQTIDDKGRASKNVYTHRRSDTALISVLNYDENDKLQSEFLYDPENKGRVNSYKFFNSKGKCFWSQGFDYEGGKLVKVSKKFGNRYIQVNYIYNEEDQLAKIEFHKDSEGNIYKNTIITKVN